MSAPSEVWGARIPWSGSWVLTADKRVGSTARYLRADLKCGECLFANNPDFYRDAVR